MVTQKKWISDASELQDLVKTRSTCMHHPYGYFPYDHRIDMNIVKKIKMKVNEITSYDSYFKFDMRHIKIMI